MDMEKKSPLRDVMNSTMEKVREMVDANNIVGAPITTPDGVTLKRFDLGILKTSQLWSVMPFDPAVSLLHPCGAVPV